MGKCLKQKENLKGRMSKTFSSGRSKKNPGFWVKREEAGHSNRSKIQNIQKIQETAASFENFEKIPKLKIFRAL